jgi:hypothetical protein
LYCSSLVSVHTHYLVFSDNFHGLIDVWYARPDSWDLAQLRVTDMDLRTYRRICGTCMHSLVLVCVYIWFRFWFSY